MISKVEKMLEMMTKSTNTNLQIILDPNIQLIESYDRMKETAAAISCKVLHLLCDGHKSKDDFTDISIVRIFKK